MEQTRNDLEALGLRLCSVSYDSVEILREFAARRGITFPMLADPDSAIIRRFGLLNEGAQPGTREHGVCHPGIFLVDASGIVRERFVEHTFYHRMTMPSILWRLGAATAEEHSAVERAHVRLRASAPQRAVHPGNRVTLSVDVVLRPGAHVYGPDVGGDYQGLAVTMDPQPWLTVHPARYPPPRVLRLPWSNEVLTGYAEPVRIEIDIALGTRQELAALLDAGQGLTLTGTCSLQACDDRVCWPRDSVKIEWRFDLIAPDLARVPEPLQHKAKGSGSP